MYKGAIVLNNAILQNGKHLTTYCLKICTQADTDDNTTSLFLFISFVFFLLAFFFLQRTFNSHVFSEGMEFE